MCQWGVTPSVVLISPAFQFSSFMWDQTGAGCRLPTSDQCGRQPSAQCARVPAAAIPATVSFSAVDDSPTAKLQNMSNWFPKMITTQPVDADMVSRDPQIVEKMTRDRLCWHSGYRA